jgi:hypothetical protein
MLCTPTLNKSFKSPLMGSIYYNFSTHIWLSLLSLYCIKIELHGFFIVCVHQLPIIPPSFPKLHYNNRGLFCDPNIIANNKERCFRNPAVANHNSSQTLKLLRYHNIRTCTIASPSQLPNLIQSQNFSDYNCFYPLFVINITSKTICSKPIIATT